MILQNFQISEDRNSLIGLSSKILFNFLRKFAHKSSPNKMYCIKIIEVTHSQLSRNYLYVILNEYSEYTGYSSDALEKRFLHTLGDLVNSSSHDFYTKELFFDEEVINPSTGEIIPSKLKSISKFNQTALNRYIDFIIACISNDSPDFIIPDPAQYLKERKGQKNELLFPNEVLPLK